MNLPKNLFKNLLFFIGLSLCVSQKAYPMSENQCSVLFEKADRWASVTDQLDQLAGSTTDLLPALQKLEPKLVQQLEGLSSLDPSWKNLWGQSINFDANAHAQIVEPAILTAMSKASGIQVIAPVQPWPGHQIVHAGIEHTYGYLLSNLTTPYGFKRDRWVKGELERGFKFSGETFGPTPQKGSLFANVTYFTGSIAFRDAPIKQALLAKGKFAVSDSLRDFDYSKLKIIRVLEVVQAPLPDGSFRKVILRTDLVSFASDAVLNPEDTDAGLLIYSVDDASEDGPRLVTAFPVAQAAILKLTSASTLGASVDIRTQYNAYVQGLSEQDLLGSRTIDQASPPY